MQKQRIHDAIALLEIAGLTTDTDSWICIDKIAEIRSYLLTNQEEIEEKLPKFVIGDLSLLDDNSKYKRTILSLIRRLALYCSSAILRKRLKDIKKKTNYGYKLATPISRTR
tara:strand:- start:73 stop:408 length:336 start_codon:yes stop_codon:yes gene_type:complete